MVLLICRRLSLFGNSRPGLRWVGSMRPLVKLDAQVEDDVDQRGVKPKNHRGIFNRGVSRLPEKLLNAISKTIESMSNKSLLQESKKLNNHLIFKKPPLSADDIDAIKRSIEMEIHGDSSLDDLSHFSSKDQKRLTDSLKYKARKRFCEKAYRWRAVNYDESSSIHYLVARVAPNYGSLSYVFQEMSRRDPDFKPHSLFDFGSGIGTVIWAAKTFWKNSIKETFCVDSSIHMNNLALALLQDGVRNSAVESTMDSAAAKGLYFRQFMPISDAVKYDLVVCAHTLLELPSSELRLQTALSLWRKCQGYLVFVEHGNRASHQVLMEVREFLMSVAKAEGATNLQGHVFSPCPHESSCPRLSTDDTPCNFEIKYEPLLAEKEKHLEKDTFTYFVLKKGERGEADPQWPRVVRPVLLRSRHTICRLCTKEGQLEEVVVTRSKHNKTTYACARKSTWGDLLPVDLSTPEPQKCQNGVEENSRV